MDEQVAEGRVIKPYYLFDCYLTFCSGLKQILVIFSNSQLTLKDLMSILDRRS